MDKIKSKKTLIGVGLLVVAGIAIKAMTSSKNEENNDGVIDVKYTECQEEITYHDDIDTVNQVESQEKSE